jgi:hypothetical protein
MLPRWRLSVVLLMPLTGCASHYAVADAATAISIGKKECDVGHPQTRAAELAGDTWTIHGRDLKLPLPYQEVYTTVTREGVVITGCAAIHKPGVQTMP